MISRLPIAADWGMLYAASLDGVPKKEHHEAAHRLLQETLPVYAAYRAQKVGCRNGVKLTCGLVKNKYFGSHSHNRCEVQKLLLAAREL